MDWMDGDVVAEEEMPITAGQVNRLLKMIEALRLDGVLGTVVCIKDSISQKDMMYANQLWDCLSEEEQTALWVAPSYGGIFTTEERKIIQGGFKNEQD